MEKDKSIKIKKKSNIEIEIEIGEIGEREKKWFKYQNEKWKYGSRRIRRLLRYNRTIIIRFINRW